MVKVITYGTYDVLHYGHIRLLQRAKDLGDYLIVGVTSDDYDKVRGKINNKQSLMDRIEAVRATGLADEIIVEEYDGQKIDDIIKYGADIFTVGSDWKGKFDYLSDYCQVVYLPRTEGVSSTEIRSEIKPIRFGVIGEKVLTDKYAKESVYVNGLALSKCSNDENEFDLILEESDAIYIATHPTTHYRYVKKALLEKKHVICESPIALNEEQCTELFTLAEKNGVVLMDAIKTAYATAFTRLLLLAKSGKIGRVISVDAVCTSLKDLMYATPEDIQAKQNSLYAWAPTALLPVFCLFGADYEEKHIQSYLLEGSENFDLFTKIDFSYANSVASIKVGKGVKSEGSLVISGTKGYIYVPAPWWKTDYFELRFENQEDNKRYFYQLDGEGIRYELVAFHQAVEGKRHAFSISQSTSVAISKIMQDFLDKNAFKSL